MQRVLIGLAGQKYHGKDTAAAILAPHLDAEIVRFADPLKNMLREFYRTAAGTNPPLLEERIEGSLKESADVWLEGKSPREAMQTLGTEWGRNNIHQELWVNTLLRRVERMRAAIVPDVRFANECYAIQRAGGRVFRIDAGARVPDGSHSDHASEREIKDLPVDDVIDNSGSAVQLVENLSAVLRKFYAGVYRRETALESTA